MCLADPVDSPQRKRGRPYRPPADRSPYAAATGGSQERIAWLLGTNRLWGGDGAFASRRAFVPALAAAGVPADESRLSRWEAGGVPLSNAVVEGYERALGLAPLQLAAVTQCLRPVVPPASGRIDSDELHALFDPLFDLVLDGEPAGADWLGFTEALLAHPGVYLRPGVWEQLARRLLTELGRSIHLAYSARLLALRRLLVHPVAQRHVVYAIGHVATDRCAPRSADAIALVQHVGGAFGTGVAMRLFNSDQEAHRRGASRAMAAMLARDDFDEESLPALEAAAVRQLSEDETAVHVADLVLRMPLAVAERIRAAFRGHPAMELVGRAGELVSNDVSRQVAQRVAEEARRQTTGPSGADPDPMLERLLREALFHANAERRSQAGMLLMFSPFRDGIASGVAAQLATGPEPPVAGRLVRLLRYCITKEELPALLALQPAADAGARPHALQAIAHLPVALDPADASALAAQPDVWRDPRLAAATMYALGMHGHAELAAGRPEAADFAAWWRTTGPRLTA